jgi:hypothetical protein
MNSYQLNLPIFFQLVADVRTLQNEITLTPPVHASTSLTKPALFGRSGMTLPCGKDGGGTHL